MRLRATWIVPAALVVAGSYAFYNLPDAPQRGDAASAGRGSTAAAGDAATLEQLRLLRQEVAALKSLAESRGRAEVARDAPSVNALPAKDPTQEFRLDLSGQAEEAQRFEAHVAGIAANFGREMRDQRWSSETSSLFESALAAEELKDMRVKNLECRARTCRLEIEDDGKFARLMPLLAVELGGTLPNVIAQRVERPGGRATMILYMSKDKPN